MSHGFDDNGRQYDARGELHDWWSEDTVANYDTRSTCISDLFSTYSIDDRHVNGKYTLGEDIADAGGLKFSYQVYIHAYVYTRYIYMYIYIHTYSCIYIHIYVFIYIHIYMYMYICMNMDIADAGGLKFSYQVLLESCHKQKFMRD